MSHFQNASPNDIDQSMHRSMMAFKHYRKTKPHERAGLMRTIADKLSEDADELVDTAARETNLEISRLRTELSRTIFQMKSYAMAVEDGTALDITIDMAEANKPDLRKMLVPLGPVVVFGASNFPFAYSTAGGDTACALAAGCTVVVKAHPAHPHTSEKVYKSIQRAIISTSMPADIFIHIHGESFDTGKLLVQHPLTRAVGFTGSLQGGRALFDLANQRQEPIPVFAEMGSVNPVFMLPGKLKEDMKEVTEMYARSITNSAGQFCTKPGLMVAIDNEVLDEFESVLGSLVSRVKPPKMLHPGIARSFIEKRKQALDQEGVKLIAMSEQTTSDEECMATLAAVPADIFIENPLLHEEVFGAFSVLIKCKDQDQMVQVASSIKGQLTATLLANDDEVKSSRELIEALTAFCGRMILNGVPTGVQVSKAMHHGGPYPASTDSRFTAVGADGIKRFARPVCYQNWKNELLPDELKNENPLKLNRTFIK